METFPPLTNVYWNGGSGFRRLQSFINPPWVLDPWIGCASRGLGLYASGNLELSFWGQTWGQRIHQPTVRASESALPLFRPVRLRP